MADKADRFRFSPLPCNEIKATSTLLDGNESLSPHPNIMRGRRSLQELVQDAGISPILARQPCLPAPSQPAVVASEEDHILARNLLVDQRRNDPNYKDPNKQLKRIFRSSKEKGKLEDSSLWDFSQDELDRALSAVIDQPTTSPGLVQAFLRLGAKVNFVETFDDRKSKGIKATNVSARRRSTVLQRAATVRKADSVGLLASSGADQTTLDEALKAALSANDHSCVQELLRYGANINAIPNALAEAVRTNNQNLVRLLLRAPKALRPDIISSCLPAAVQQKSEVILSLLIGNGADPNFNSASALSMAISAHDYRLTVALAAGPIPLLPSSLQAALEPTMKITTVQELHRFLQVLLCCGLPPDSYGLAGMLATATRRNDHSLALLLVDYGVSTAMNEAECLRNVIAQSNWELSDAILKKSVQPAHASVALAVLPADAPKDDRLRIIGSLLQKGASGPPLGRWLVRAVEDGDSVLTDLLLRAGAPLDSGNNRALQLAIMRKDGQSLRTLLKAKPSPGSLAQLFPLLRQNHARTELLDMTKLLLEHGARGVDVDRALVDAVADTSPSRDIALVTELVRHGADVNYDNGKAVQLATMQSDVLILQLLCKAKASAHTTSSALPMVFGSNGSRSSKAMQLMELLMTNEVEEQPALEAVRLAINGGPGSIDIITRLIIANRNILDSAFTYAVTVDDSNKKAAIVKALLTLGLRQETLDSALVTEVQHLMSYQDPAILKLLLEFGSSINYNHGEALSIMVSTGSLVLTNLLLQAKENPSRSTVTRAFVSLFKDSEHPHTSIPEVEKLDIARALLLRGVEQPAIDATLRASLETTTAGVDIETLVDLLLQYNANINTSNGICYVLSLRQQKSNIFKKLLAHKPDFATLVPVILVAKFDDETVVKALNACFDHGCTADDIELRSHGDFRKVPLVLSLQEYPRSVSIVDVLLSHGCNPEITINDTIDPTVGEEGISPLLWALAQPQKMISSSVITALLRGGASPTRYAPASEMTPIALAAREGRQDIVGELLKYGADPSARDKWNRSALFFASSTSVTPIVLSLSANALKDDGSLHEAARALQVDNARILIKQGHKPSFPSRLHGGRNALGELCLNADVNSSTRRTGIRQLIQLLLDNGAKPSFKARNERSSVLLALDNPHSSFEVTEALLETDTWEELNDEKHMYRDERGLWYSPLKYVELIPNHGRARHKNSILELLLDKGCVPKFYSEHAEQPDGATGMPDPIAKLADRQKDHQLSLKLAQETSEHTRMLEETAHRDLLRRKKEQEDADMTAAAAAQAQWQSLEQSKHEFEIQRVRTAERMKRSEKVAWHNLLQEQERDSASQRQRIEDSKASAAYAHEANLIEQRKAEVEHRAGVERKALLEKEQLFERNVSRQKALTDRLDESAQLHARLRQDRPAIEGAQWGNVD